MDALFLLLILIIIVAALLWFGYTVLDYAARRKGEKRGAKGNYRRVPKKNAPQVKSGGPGDSRNCPLCDARLGSGEQVKSTAFPGLPGQGRLMHIRGCAYCMDGSRERVCPVCGAVIGADQILVARMFEKPGRSHVHILGCSRCREALAGGAGKSR
jgi:hypothetical protein